MENKVKEFADLLLVIFPLLPELENTLMEGYDFSPEELQNYVKNLESYEIFQGNVIACNDYDLGEDNVQYFEYNVIQGDSQNCQGGNYLTFYKKDNKDIASYIVLYNVNSGLTIFEF